MFTSVLTKQNVMLLLTALVLSLAAPAQSDGGKPAVIPASQDKSPSVVTSDLDRSAIDPSVDACQDFYQHACGGFISSVVLTPTHTEASLMDQAFDASLNASLAKLFAINAPPGSQLFRLKTFYASCLNDSPSSAALVQTWLSRINAAQSPRDIQRLLLVLSEIGVDPFFAYSGSSDPGNLSRYRGEIDYANLWQQPEVVENAFLLAGAPPAQAKSDALAVGQIIGELRKYRTTGDDPTAYQNPTTLAQLRQQASAIDWQAYFAMVGAEPDRPINVTSNTYLPAVSRQLTTRSPAQLRAYLRWAFLFSLRGELPAPYNQAFANITPPLRVAVDQPARRCQDATIRGMGVEFSRQYSLRVLGLPARQAAMRIGASIQNEIANSVQQDDWLTPTARSLTADKLRKTRLKIGFPDQWPPVGNFDVKPHQFFANVLASRRFEERRAWSRANETRSRDNWDMLVYPWVGTGMAAARLVTPNAFPDLDTNSMIMTAAFLNPPRFDASANPAANYAVFGAVFAHEFVHIAEEHQYDADGHQQDIWSAADLAAANRQHQCVIDQADASPAPPGSKISGKGNYSENLADLGGIRLAYTALTHTLGSQIDQPGPDGTTPAQRFFLKFAQSYCTAASPETLKNLVADDPHGLPAYRVNGPLSNLPAFGVAFGCPVGSPMRRAPDKVCRVW